MGDWERIKYLKRNNDAPPTDGLWDDRRTDEGQLGMSYKDIEIAMNDPKSPNRENTKK